MWFGEAKESSSSVGARTDIKINCRDSDISILGVSTKVIPLDFRNIRLFKRSAFGVFVDVAGKNQNAFNETPHHAKSTGRQRDDHLGDGDPVKA